MGLKSDHWIRDMVISRQMIEPFADQLVSQGVISYGLSSYGYDMRVADEFKLIKPVYQTVLDPKNMTAIPMEDVKSAELIIPPNSYVLGRSVEYFRIPRNVLTICFGKSTYARCGVLINVTPFEPEWEGFVTMSIANLSSTPVKIYAHEGIAQVIFFEGDESCLTSYADRKGKYQKQQKIELSKT